MLTTSQYETPREKTCFFWAFTSANIIVCAWFRLPECKGRTYEELNILFANKTPARKFATAHVDAYEAAGKMSHETHGATVKQ